MHKIPCKITAKMKFKLYLDTRATKKGKTAPLKLSIAHRNDTALLNLGISILPSQFNSKTEKIENHPNKVFLNNFLSQRKNEVEKYALELSLKGTLNSLSATEFKNYVKNKINNTQDSSETFMSVADKFIATKKRPHTAQIYKYSLSLLRKYYPAVDNLSFEDITVDFLTKFDNYLVDTKSNVNTRGIVFRSIRAVFNYAIGEDITTAYPFRKFKVKSYEQQTTKSLTVEQLREIIKKDLPQNLVPIRDYFVLTFYLIGINVADLLRLTDKSISNLGRLDYIRAKTGKKYSIKIQPETAKLLDKYKGKNHLLLFGDEGISADHFSNKLAAGLKKIMPSIPNLSLYWARHTWATIAASLEIPKETIAHALGHGNRSVTDVYIDFDEKKVDKANRQVLDYVFDGKQDDTTAPTK
jgi:site-specific recombinase XerD